MTLTHSVYTNYSNNLTKLWLSHSVYVNYSNNLTKLWLCHSLCTSTTTWPCSLADTLAHQVRGSRHLHLTGVPCFLPESLQDTTSGHSHHDLDGSVFGWGWAAAAALTHICSLDQASVTRLMSSSLQQTLDPSAMILINLQIPQFSNYQKDVRWLQNSRCLWTTYKCAFWHTMEHELHSALLQSRAMCSHLRPRTSGV